MGDKFSYSEDEWSRIQDASPKQLVVFDRNLLESYASVLRDRLRVCHLSDAEKRESAELDHVAELAAALLERVLLIKDKFAFTLSIPHKETVHHVSNEEITAAIEEQKRIEQEYNSRFHTYLRRLSAECSEYALWLRENATVNRDEARRHYFVNVLDFWLDMLGGALRFSRRPSDKQVVGPLPRFLDAVCTPVLGPDMLKPEGIASLVDREKKRRADEVGHGPIVWGKQPRSGL